MQAHLPIWRENRHFRIDAVMEPLPERALLVKELLPEARIYSRLAPLFAENRLDYVDICTPPCFHADIMINACRSGMHVFCEKPLVTSLKELRRIHRIARQLDRVVFTVNNWKYAPLWNKAIKLTHEENKVGTVRSVSISVLRPPNSGGGVSNWRRCVDIAGGGILLDHGWHNLYLILSVIRETPCAISAKIEYTDVNGSSIDETVDLVIRFPNAEARLYLTWQAAVRQNHGTITGDRGTLSIHDDHLVLDTVAGRSPIRYDFSDPLSGGSHHRQWMDPVVTEFHRELWATENRASNFMEATWCAYLTHLAYRSHREGSRFIQVETPIP
jgi:predicted dehydrogenase